MSQFRYPLFSVFAVLFLMAACSSPTSSSSHANPTPTPTGNTLAGIVTTLAGGGSLGANASGNADGTGTAATFNLPFSVAVDSLGNVYVADTENNVIRKITSSGVVTTLAGGGSVGGNASGNADGTGTAATFAGPRGVAVDSSGNVYVADFGPNLVRKVTPSGVVTTLAGGGSVGGTSAGNADGTGTDATFWSPSAVTIDVSGNLYVTDYENGLVRKITPSGVVTTIAGGGSVGGTASGHANGTGTAATFKDPSGIAMDSAGNLYVADAGNHLIRKITPSGVVTTVAGGGSAGGTVSGHADGTGTAATFNFPTGIALDSSGVLYIADSGNHLIRKIR